ncbi:MAG: hypothetical protein IMF12_10215 [Proteobacteria bacterium]|nr:hypothetical protein [Pseudomonadota bacterium]
MINKIIGKWKITEMEQWNSDFINAQGMGYFEFNDTNQGSFIFGYVEGDISFRKYETGEKLEIKYSWSGQDEMDEASGQGSFELINDDEIYGIICFHEGDESWVKAKRIK